ncbi:MAG: amidohydrolase family protein [Gemmatimonadota bacterium]|nr:amidohydrolase family protein [Gemmatimonadota bacterium]
MSERADAHIHLFEGGYQDSFMKRLGRPVDEAVVYASLAKDHGVKAALIVGYADVPWAAENTRFLKQMVAEYDWVYPAAYFDPSEPPTTDELAELQVAGFVGVSFYIFGPERVDALLAISDEVWQWLVSRRWLVSVNSKGDDWNAWQKVLGRHPELRLALSHLGLPPRQAAAPSARQARTAMASVLALAEFPQSRVKLSGFYALTDPGHDFPHRAAWPYVEALVDAYGVERLLWASDYSPCLDCLTFPQTVDLFSKMPFLTAEDRTRIEGSNLLALLEDVKN